MRSLMDVMAITGLPAQCGEQDVIAHSARVIESGDGQQQITALDARPCRRRGVPVGLMLARRRW